AHDSVSESLNCLFGSSSPRRPEQTPDQRARLAHPDSQIDCQIAVLCRSRRQPLTVSTTKQPVKPINRQTTTGLDTARKVSLREANSCKEPPHTQLLTLRKCEFEKGLNNNSGYHSTPTHVRLTGKHRAPSQPVPSSTARMDR